MRNILDALKKAAENYQKLDDGGPIMLLALGLAIMLSTITATGFEVGVFFLTKMIGVTGEAGETVAIFCFLLGILILIGCVRFLTSPPRWGYIVLTTTILAPLSIAVGIVAGLLLFIFRD